MNKSEAGKGPDPRPIQDKKAYDNTLRSVYGTRVKIPPPGPEREELVLKLIQKISTRYFWGNFVPQHEKELVERTLDTLEDFEYD